MQSKGRRFLHQMHPTGRSFLAISTALAVLAVLTAAAFLFGILVDDNPFGPSLGAFLLMLLAAFILFAVWAVTLVVRLVVLVRARPYHRTEPQVARRWTQWLAFPAILVTTVAVLVAMEPLVWQLYTEPRLDDRFVDAGDVDAAASADATETEWVASSEPPIQIGQYTIEQVHRSGANVAMLDPTMGWLFDRGGIAYLPDGPDDVADWPWGDRQLTFSPIGDHWYTWRIVTF